MTAGNRAGWALVLVLVPAAAFASGFLFGENGARALSLGGAFTGQADDLTAIQHNPAGLTQQRGFTFLLDGFALNHDVRFLRRDPDGTAVANEVSNSGGFFVLPFLGAGWGQQLGGRSFTAALGIYGPPSVGRYQFPEPNYAKHQNDAGRTVYDAYPVKFAPQRYGLIRNDIIILFPTLSVAYEVLPRVSVGASVQYVYASLMFRQAVTSILFTPDKQAKEDPAYDSIVEVRQTGKAAFTGIFGVLVKPADWLQVGASYRPPVPLHTEGTADISLGEIPSQLATVEGRRASFALTLPQELKLGVHATPLPALGLNADLVYQGWQSVDAFVLTPEDITLTMGSGEPRKLNPIVIPKKWHHTLSGRFGAQYRFGFGLTARAGVLYEESASPKERLHIDFLHPSRVFATGGLEYPLGPVSLVLAGAVTPVQTLEVSDSLVTQANTDPGVPGSVIGNGTYTTGGWIVGVGVHGSFGPAGPAGSSSLDASHGVLQL